MRLRALGPMTALLLAALAVLAALAGVRLAAAAEPAGRTPKPVILPAAAGTSCVADPKFMRRNHMELLKHQRDVTVRAGVREAKDSLQGCVSCHASPTSGSVAATPTDFCSSCHSYAAVTIDCFECHSHRPARAAAAGAAKGATK